MPQIGVDLRSKRPGAGLLAGPALALAYVAAGRLGLLLAVPPGYATAIFPPAGIAVAAMFIAGPRTLPWTFVGSLVLNLWAGHAAYHRLDALLALVAVVIACGSTLQAAIAGSTLARLIGRPASLDNARDLTRFFLSSPLLCVTSATLSLSGLAALGVVDAADFATSWLTWWIGDTLGVLLLLPLIMIAAGEPRTLWRSRMLPVAVPLLLFFTLFVSIFIVVSSWENEQSLLEFRVLSQQVLDKVQARLGAQQVFLEQLGRSFVGPARLSREDFRSLVQDLLRRFPVIQAVEWAPRVDAAHRAEFEAAQRQELAGFGIRERNANGRLSPAGPRAEFFPVTYLEPSQGNETALGFDLASEPKRRAAIAAATDTQSVSATAPVRLVQDAGDQAGMLLTSWVPAGKNGPGILVIVLQMSTFMDALLGSARQSINVQVLDVERNAPLFDTLPADRHGVPYQQNFDFAGRKYSIRTAPSSLYLAQHRSWQSTAVLMAGVLSTSLLGALLLLGTGERHRFARLLAERTRERDRIWQVSEDLLGIGNFEGYFVSVNPAWERVLGWTAQEIRVRHVSELRHPDDVEAAMEGRRRLAAGVPTVRMENRFRHKDGSYRWIYWTMTAEKGLIYVIGRDVTADKEAAQTLRRTEEELRQLQKMESVGQLTGGIAHDFNNLLTAVLGNLEAAQKRVTDAPALRFLAGAGRAAERGARLTEQLLAFSRKQHLQTRGIDINELVLGMRDMLHRSLGATVEVDQHLASELWPALADPNQLELAILNLAINARDAMPIGGRLLIETSNAAPGDRHRPAELTAGDYVCIAVSDTGTGMSDEVMAKALEPFFTTKEPGKGSGLGLSMVHGVAKQSGGGVSLSSRPGHGTTVRIYLPRAAAVAAPRAAAPGEQKFDVEGLAGKAVLVIDDDPDVREVASTMLADLGCRTLPADSGRAGLAALDQDGAIDLVVVDFAMPGMNGIEVAEAILAKRPDLPIVMVTGYADIDLAALVRDGLHLLKKPFQRAELASILLSAMARENRDAANLVRLRSGNRSN